MNTKNILINYFFTNKGKMFMETKNLIAKEEFPEETGNLDVSSEEELQGCFDLTDYTDENSYDDERNYSDLDNYYDERDYEDSS